MDQIVKTKPILFSTEMVQAILEGRKLQTRRSVKFVNYHPSRTEKQHSLLQVKGFEVYDGNGDHIGNLRDKYGKIGDILWVREKFQKIINCETGEFNHYDYYADKPQKFHKQFPRKYKPSIHMPKEACRLFLKITNIRVERLWDISEEAAIKEGIKTTWIHDDIKQCMFKNYMNDGRGSLFAVDSFKSLWQSINGKESLESNPWVWVIEFERVEKPEKFN